MGPKKDSKKQVQQQIIPQKPQLQPYQTQGYGRFQYIDNILYVGNWQLHNGIKYKHGYGTLIVKIGNIESQKYQGNWVMDQMSGFGIYRYPSGAQYSGQFLKNKHHGKGIYKFPNGSIYEGDWQNHLMHGFGSFTNSQGKKLQGEFRNGNFYSKIQKQLVKEKQLQVRKNLILKSVNKYIETVQSILQKSNQQNFRENIKNFFPQKISISQFVRQLFVSPTDYNHQKWKQYFTYLKLGQKNILTHPTQAKIIQKAYIINEQLLGQGQIAQIVYKKQNHQLKCVLVNINQQYWGIVKICYEQIKH